MPSGTEPEILTKVNSWKLESENNRTMHDDRWARNMKLVNGVFNDEELERSRTRNRSKLFFRKIWATRWRLTASFYNAFLRDQNIFEIEDRDGINIQGAGVLQAMVEYRRDSLYRNDSFFLKMIWGFFNITDLGWAAGKWRWVKNKEQKIDEPRFTLYPNEQVYPDLSAETKEQMRYIIFEHFMTEQDMEEMGYDNIEDAVTEEIPHNQVRATRYINNTDPFQNPGADEYPSPGSIEDGTGDSAKQSKEQVYRVWETFYKEDGKIKIVVTNGNHVILKETKDSPYGRNYNNVSLGSCLTKAHLLIGEGFPEPLEGPQESYNANINQRKDNVALSLNRQTIVGRHANTDLQSLVNSRPGGITLTDDPSSVVDRAIPDVTSSSYVEASTDEAMMDEMSGVTPGKRGQEKTDKATVAQINFAEANAKIDLYIAIVGETFIRDIFSSLAFLEQTFETDKKIFKVANNKFRIKNKLMALEDIDDVDDFNINVTVKVGIGTVGHDLKTKQTMLALDRAIQSNSSVIQLLQTGAIPEGEVKLFDTTKFMGEILPDLGHKNIEDFYYTVKPPAQPQGQGAGPQQTRDLNEANDLQRGSLGGI